MSTPCQKHWSTLRQNRSQYCNGCSSQHHNKYSSRRHGNGRSITVTNVVVGTVTTARTDTEISTKAKLVEATEETIILIEVQLLADPCHIVHIPMRTFKATKESMLCAFCRFLTRLKVRLEGVSRCSANLMTNNAELKFFTLKLQVISK